MAARIVRQHVAAEFERFFTFKLRRLDLLLSKTFGRQLVSDIILENQIRLVRKGRWRRDRGTRPAS
ncbi:hypothetical protein D3C86_2029100 [compost metagenome]